MMAIFTWIARSLFRTLDSIAIPCSVKTKGRYRRPPHDFEVAICDLKFSAFPSLNRVTRGMDGLRDGGGEKMAIGGESPPIAPKDPPDTLPTGLPFPPLCQGRTVCTVADTLKKYFFGTS